MKYLIYRKGGTTKLKNEKTNCYECIHRGNISGDAHSKCNNKNAKVSGNKNGIRNGWFCHPYNFDPVWLEKCDGFEAK
jgi:hypothetical protein